MSARTPRRVDNPPPATEAETGIGHAPPIPLAPLRGWTARTVQEAELARLTRQYTPLAGTPRNALNLLVGLRTGSAVTFYEDDAEFSFTPPTLPVGWSTVQRILNLARSGLTTLGIHQPRPRQVAIALMGGTLASDTAPVELPGILRLYHAGMSWAHIAHLLAQVGNRQVSTTETAGTG